MTESTRLFRWFGIIPLSLTLFSTQAIGQAFPPEFQLSSLAAGDGSAGFVVNGVDDGDFSGVFLNVGDLNGDGIDDLIIATATADTPGQPLGSESGEVYVVFGRDSAAGGFPATIDASSLAAGDGSNGFTLIGESALQFMGGNSAVGDVNGDGIDDLIVSAFARLGASTCDTGLQGRVYVVFGRDAAAGGFPGQVELSSLATGDGSAGFILDGESPFGEIGPYLAASDLNGDGIDELVVGARVDPCNPLAGYKAYVVYGKDAAVSGFPPALDIATLAAGNSGESFAINVVDDESLRTITVGDYNGDDIDDLLFYVFTSGLPRYYVVLGRDATKPDFPAELDLASLATGDGSNGFAVYSGAPADGLLATGGDPNGDGADDIVVGYRFANIGPPLDFREAGQTVVFYSRPEAAGGNRPLRYMGSLRRDVSKGFVLNGDGEDYQAGDALGAGDVNGDGIDDLIIGAAGGGPTGSYSGGQAYVVYGRNAQNAGFPAVFELSTLASGDGSAGFALYAADLPDQAGRAIASGDLNGDGIDDVIIGAPGASNGTRQASGKTFVVFGRSGGPSTAPTLSIDGDPTALEGDFLQFKLSLSLPVLENVSFNVRSIDQTASSPGDYEAKSGRRLFAPGETERTIWVKTVSDGIAEENETLRLKLSNVSNAKVGRASATGTIVDKKDDAGLPTLSVADASAAEGQFARFNVTLSKPSDNDVIFSVRTYNGTAFAGGDFDAKTGTRTIPAGQTSRTIWVLVKNDRIIESQEQFRLEVDVRSNNAVNGDGIATGTIPGQ